MTDAPQTNPEEHRAANPGGCWDWSCRICHPARPAPQTTERQFPIMDGKQRSSIPWRVMAPHEAQAERNHGQSLVRLAERGGLCWSEAWGILTGVGWSSLPRGQEDRCRAAVLAICQEAEYV